MFIEQKFQKKGEVGVSEVLLGGKITIKQVFFKKKKQRPSTVMKTNVMLSLVG